MSELHFARAHEIEITIAMFTMKACGYVGCSYINSNLCVLCDISMEVNESKTIKYVYIILVSHNSLRDDCAKYETIQI